MASEEEIVRKSHLETLYTRGFKEGTDSEGRFFNVVTLDDGSQQVDINLHERVRITLVFIKKRGDIESVQISKFRYNKRLGWRADTEECVRIKPVTLSKVLAIIKFLTELDLAGITDRRIRLSEETLPRIDDATRKKVLTLLAQPEGPALIEELLRSDALSSRDIVNVGYRKAQLEIFRRLLAEDGFADSYKASLAVRQAGAEPAWQAFFERNPWVFGYGLNYIWCTNLPDSKLEQVVSGHDFGAAGKRADGLLKSIAQISQFVLVEIKTPDTSLVTAMPRPGVWAPSPELAAGVAQIQKTVSQFKQRYYEKAELSDESGEPYGAAIYNFSPKSYLLAGSLSQFKSDAGVNKAQYSSFQLFRGSLRDPEIITFDELYARAQAIVDMAAR